MKKGFTFFEVIVILALFSIVALLAFSLLLSSTNNFRRSQENSDMYYQARRASDFVRDEVRYADTLNLIAISAIDDTSSNSYLYVEDGGSGYGKLILQIGTDKRELTGEIIVVPVSFSVVKDANDNNSISYTFVTRYDNSVGNREHVVPTTIYLNNIKSKDATTGVCIEYTKP